MSDKLIYQPFHELVALVSSKSAAPGGGSIAAAAGALGAGLIEMSCKFTIGNDKYQTNWDEIQAVLEEVEKYRSELIELVDRDSEAYNGIVKVFRSKKDLIAEKGEGEFQDQLQAAYKHAAEVPLKTAETSFEVLKFAKTVAENGNTNTITDTGVGAQMAYAGIVGGLLNVKINLNSIRNENYRSDIDKKIIEIEKEAAELINNIMEIVNSKL